MQEAPTPTRPQPARILLADSHPIVRFGLAHLIGGEADLTVVEQVGRMEDLAEAVERTHPDLVVSEILFGEAEAMGLLREIRQRHPGLRVLVLTMTDAPDLLRRAIQAGMEGMISKREGPEMLLMAVRRVLAGSVHMGREALARTPLPGTENGRAPAFALDGLTERELEVLQLMGQGLRPRHVAARLGLSAKTVNSHRENMKKKLALTTAAELDQFAVRWVQELHSITG